MMYLQEVSSNGADSLAVDLSRMSRKVGLGWIQAVGYLSRFGSVPANERALASILNVSVPFLRDVAWPALEDRFVSSEDGRRFICPDIRQTGPARVRARPPLVAPSARHQRAANIRHHGNPLGPVAVHDSDATDDASCMQPDAKDRAKSTSDASDFSAIFADSDATVASVADARAGAPSLSDSGSSVSQTLENPGVLERGDAGAHGHASAVQKDATERATPDATEHVTPAPTSKPRLGPIPRDWRPSPAHEQAARAKGHDPAWLAEGFRLHYQKTAKLLADVDAGFFDWIRREHGPGRQQNHLPPMVITGGRSGSAAASPEPDETEDELGLAVGDGPEARWARVRQKLKAEIGGSTFRSFVKKAEIVSLEDDGELRISLPTGFLRDRVRKDHGDRLLALWQAEEPGVRRIEFVVASLRGEAAESERRAGSG